MRKDYIIKTIKSFDTENLPPEMEMYEQYLEDRDLSSISMYSTSRIPRLEPEKMRKLNFKRHVWKTGDKFHKLSFEYYSDQKFWWVISWFNRAPTEHHLSLGDTIYIPTPLGQVLKFFKGR